MTREGKGKDRGLAPMTHVPCGGDIVERVCRNVVYYNDSMIGAIIKAR